MKKHILPLVFTTLGLLISGKSFAYLSLNETAELLQNDDYRVGLAPQQLLSDSAGNTKGSNVGAFFDFATASDTNARFMIGAGDTDFWASASLKWVPYPDFDSQPAIGFRGAFIYARDANLNFYDLQGAILASKIYDTQWGKMNPYVGLPLTLVYTTSSTTTSIQAALGNEWIVNPSFQVGAELDLNVSKSFSALSIYVNFPFDGNTGFRK